MYLSYAEHNNRYTYVDKTTSLNEEMLTDSLFDPEVKNPRAKKIQIAVDSDLLILVNNRDKILIKPNYGLFLDYQDKAIESIKALTSDVNFYAIIGY